MPAISVIVPVYNTEKYLRRCVDSILDQTFEDFELILVDDGSTDASGAICDEYAAKDGRVRVIHKENEGVSIARNLGSREAFGEYISFIDSDDYVGKEYLSTLFTGVREYGGDICVSDYFSSKKDFDDSFFASPKYYSMSGREAIERFGKSGGSRFRGPVSKLVARYIVIENPFPEGRSFSEDLATNYRYYSQAKTVVDNGSRLYCYYTNPESVSNKAYSLRKVENTETLEELLSFLKENSFPELYEYYYEEYCFDLFRNYINIRKNQLDDELEKVLFNKFCKAVNLEIPRSADTVESLLDFFKSVNCMKVYSVFLHRFIKDLYRSAKKKESAYSNALVWDPKVQMKRIIRKNCIRFHIWPKTYPEEYNYLWPRMANVYWLFRYARKKFGRKNNA